jgi:hypothetical protein
MVRHGFTLAGTTDIPEVFIGTYVLYIVFPASAFTQGEVDPQHPLGVRP